MLADGYCCCLLCVIDPFAHYTHWKQTVFYMDDFITVKKGEEVNGVFHLKPNERNIVCTAVSVFAVAVVFFTNFLSMGQFLASAVISLLEELLQEHVGHPLKPIP